MLSDNFIIILNLNLSIQYFIYFEYFFPLNIHKHLYQHIHRKKNPNFIIKIYLLL